MKKPKPIQDEKQLKKKIDKLVSDFRKSIEDEINKVAAANPDPKPGKNLLSEISNAFQIEDMVYLKHDPDQVQRMVVEIRMRKYDFVYVLQSAEDISEHSDFEISKEKVYIN